MQINCIIVEDEPLAQERTRGYVQQLPFLNLLSVIDNGVEALLFLRSNKVDLVFLDINMGEFSGIQLLEALPVTSQVIIITAYHEYALKGFELNVTDYLLKPYTFGRFVQAVDRAQQNLVKNEALGKMQGMSGGPAGGGEGAVTPVGDGGMTTTGGMGESGGPVTGGMSGTTGMSGGAALGATAGMALGDKRFIFIKTEYRLEKVLLSEILYIEGMRDYRRVHTIHKPIMTLQLFGEFEREIPPAIVCRVHKSYMVSIDKIDSIARNRIRIGGVMVPISETYKKRFWELVYRRE
ncbi:MAG TPA: response regulator transcription factor [Puia sp.]|jgi:DNA-binding LytR/AlgR family response regulator